MNDFKYVCFDLDGTLVASGDGIKASVEYVLDYYKIDRELVGDLDKFIGPPLDASFQKYCGFSKDQIDDVIKVFRSDYLARGQYNMSLYDGVIDLLARLNDNGVNIALVTSKLKTVSQDILKRFGIYKYFKFVAGSLPDNTMTDKRFLLDSAIKYFNIEDKSQIVMVGDREYDVIGANANDVSSIGVLYGYGSYNELRAAGATYFADSIEDLKILLKVK